MNIEERDSISFGKGLAFYVCQPPPDFTQPPNRYVTGNDGVGNASKPPLLQMNVRAADFAQLYIEQRRTEFEFRFGKFSQLNGCAGAGHQCGNYSIHEIRLCLLLF